MIKNKQTEEKEKKFEVELSTPIRKYVPIYLDFLQNTVLSAKEKLVFIALKSFISFGSNEGKVYPSIDKLSQLTSLSASSVSRALKGLEEKGILKKKRRGLTKTNIYSLSDMTYMWKSETKEEMQKASESKIDISTEDLLEELIRRGYTVTQKKEPVSEVSGSTDTSTSTFKKSTLNVHSQYRVGKSESQDTERIKISLGYDDLLKGGAEKELVDAVFSRIFEIATCGKEMIYIAGEKRKTATVQEKISALEYKDVLWVIEKYQEQGHIENSHAYIGTLLYRAHEQRIQEKKIKSMTKGKRKNLDIYNSFEQRNYDYKDLERQLAQLTETGDN